MKNSAPRAEAHRKNIPALPAENGRERNSRIGSIGARGPQLPGHEPGGPQRPDGQRGAHLGPAPAGPVAAYQAPDDPPPAPTPHPPPPHTHPTPPPPAL